MSPRLLLAALLACVLLGSALAVRYHAVPHKPFRAGDELPAVKQSVVDEINSLPGNSWQASTRQGRMATRTIGDVRRMLGTIKGGRKNAEKVFPAAPAPAPIPASFDARQKWSNCSTITQIRDQSDCGSCWAFGAVEAMSDRNCIFLGKNISLSTEDMTSCCTSCGAGCGGGEPSAAWDYWVKTGVVTNTCSPYSLPGCDHHIPNSTNPCPSQEYPTPPCVKRCNDSETWSTALHYGAKAYSITSGKVADIQTEIMTNGPVETAFTVYEDFLTYKSGVYVHKTGSVLGGHAVKFLGWGVLNGTPYWLVANSWNPDWGMGGYFLILRGSNECGIEDEIDAGIPKN
jgi:cathepsin B